MLYHNFYEKIDLASGMRSVILEIVLLPFSLFVLIKWFLMIFCLWKRHRSRLGRQTLSKAS